MTNASEYRKKYEAAALRVAVLRGERDGLQRELLLSEKALDATQEQLAMSGWVRIRDEAQLMKARLEDEKHGLQVRLDALQKEHDELKKVSLLPPNASTEYRRALDNAAHYKKRAEEAEAFTCTVLKSRDELATEVKRLREQLGEALQVKNAPEPRVRCGEECYGCLKECTLDRGHDGEHFCQSRSADG